MAERLAARCFKLGFWLPLALATWLALTPSPPEVVFRVGDVVLHTGAFVYLTFALRLAHPGLHWLPVTLGMLGFGLLLELLQGLGGTRVGEWRDLAADALGIAVGLVAYRLLGAWIRQTVARLLAWLFR